MKQPSPKADQLRALREANYDRAMKSAPKPKPARQDLAGLAEKVAKIPATKPRKKRKGSSRRVAGRAKP